LSNSRVHCYRTLEDKDAKDDVYSTSKSTFLLKILFLEVGTRWNKKDAREKIRNKKKRRRKRGGGHHKRNKNCKYDEKVRERGVKANNTPLPPSHRQ
jgi:hypothetical protein